MTREEINKQLKVQYTIILDRESRLSSSDYIANKIAEGKATQEEYSDKINERQQWRDDIHAAKAEIERLKAIEPEEELPIEDEE